MKNGPIEIPNYSILNSNLTNLVQFSTKISKFSAILHQEQWRRYLFDIGDVGRLDWEKMMFCSQNNSFGRYAREAHENLPF